MQKTVRFVAGAALLALSAGSFAAGALAVSREVTVDTSPATLWKLLGNFNGLDTWHPAVASSTVKGSPTTVGSVRTLNLNGGGVIIEKLKAYSAAKQSYTYEIVKSPLPLKNYVSTIALSPAADGKTVVKWSSTFDAAGAPDDKAKEVVGGVYDGGLTKLVASFKK